MPPQGHRWWLIDEITSVSGGWPAQIKWLRDNDARFRRDTVVLTGSSSSNLRESIGELAGRRGPAEDADRLMLPVGFRTFLTLVSDAPTPEGLESSPRLSIADLTPGRLTEAAYRLAPWLHALVEAWEDYLRVGGFPQAVAGHVRHRRPDESLRTALMGVISGDAFQAGPASRTCRPPRCCAGSPRGSARRTARRASPGRSACRHRRPGIASTTSGSPSSCGPCTASGSLRPHLRAQEKIYFTDPIYARLVDPVGAPFADGPDETTLSEQQLAMALRRSLERDRPGGGGRVRPRAASPHRHGRGDRLRRA